jgi:hypothetical protein
MQPAGTHRKPRPWDRCGPDGTFSVLVDRLNLPTSLDFVGDTAFVVTLNGEVWKIDNVSELRAHH